MVLDLSLDKDRRARGRVESAPLVALNLKSGLLAFAFAEGTADHRAALALMERSLAARCGMCEKCVELDAKIDRYERLARMITDEQALAAIGQEIERANAEKAALHPEPEA